MHRLSRWPRWPFAFLIYAALSWFLLGHGLRPRRQILGLGADSQQFVWFFTWWPWAIAHHLDPFYCRLIWQPLGLPLFWVTSAPLLALLFWPVTLAAGAVPAVNACILLAPVFSATAAFWLCRALAADAAASLVGGYLFGFSSYEMAADLATPNLSFTCLVPLTAWLAVARLRGSVGRRRAIGLGALILVAQFLVSVEIFATLILFGVAAWALALALLPPQRAALLNLGRDASYAGVVALIALSPFLAMMARHAHAISLPAFWSSYFVADAVNLVVPTRLNAFGQPFLGLSRRFAGGLQEQDAYLGLPLIVALGFAATAVPAGKFLFACLGLALLASLGPLLWVAGTPTALGLPWALALHLPLIGAALPTRFALFVSLAAAIIVALWLGAATPRRAWRFALSLLACLALGPAPHVRMAVPAQPFFRPGNVVAVLGKHARLLVLPFGGLGASTFWQAESQFSYAQTGGYLGFPPAGMQHFPAVGELFSGTQGPRFAQDLTSFLRQTETDFIVAGPGTSASLTASLAALHWLGRRVDGVTLYRVPHG